MLLGLISLICMQQTMSKAICQDILENLKVKQNHHIILTKKSKR